MAQDEAWIRLAVRLFNLSPTCQNQMQQWAKKAASENSKEGRVQFFLPDAGNAEDPMAWTRFMFGYSGLVTSPERKIVACFAANCTTNAAQTLASAHNTIKHLNAKPIRVDSLKDDSVKVNISNDSEITEHAFGPMSLAAKQGDPYFGAIRLPESLFRLIVTCLSDEVARTQTKTP